MQQELNLHIFILFFLCGYIFVYREKKVYALSEVEGGVRHINVE